VRIIVLAVVAAAFILPAGVALAMPTDGEPPAPATPPSTPVLPPAILQVTTTPSSTPSNNVGGGGGGVVWPSGCRDVDVYAIQKSFLFGTTIYKFHQFKHWCWRGGAIYDERHAWSFDGGSTACLNTVYDPNAWYYSWSNGGAKSGHYSEERAHVTNCIFHFGDWKEFYPDVKIWSYANGGYNVSVNN
jgi:hypothetical protein